MTRLLSIYCATPHSPFKMSARVLNSTVDEELFDLVDNVQPGSSSNLQPDVSKLPGI